MAGLTDLLYSGVLRATRYAMESLPGGRTLSEYLTKRYPNLSPPEVSELSTLTQNYAAAGEAANVLAPGSVPIVSAIPVSAATMAGWGQGSYLLVDARAQVWSQLNPEPKFIQTYSRFESLEQRGIIDSAILDEILQIIGSGRYPEYRQFIAEQIQSAIEYRGLVRAY